MSIRPISRKFPYSQAYWEESFLPMCAIMTPLEELEESGAEDKEEDDEAANQTIANVPKCLSCGAPHPTSTTHKRFGDKILCYLCGEISSILLSDQQEVRKGEHLDPYHYDNFDHLSPEEARENKKADGDGDEDGDDSIDDGFDFTTDTIEFRMPVEEAEKPSDVIWQFPAMACPPVWWIIVDGTVGNATTAGAARNYWTTVGATISKALEDIPPHVHVGLLTATGSRLASWDLTSAVPHVQQFPYSYDPVAAKGGGDDDSASEPWDLCLVPANSHYKANLEAAIRGMVDGAMSGLFLEGASDDDEEKKTDGESNASPFVPLGLTLEILLEFMEQANHPGQDEDDWKEQGSNGMNRMRYAGGKILCLLGNPTLETGKPPQNDSMSYMGQPRFGLGGVAGECGCDETESNQPNNFPRGTRRNKSEGENKKKEEDDDTDPTDLTDSNLKEYVIPLEPDNLFATIGKECAKAALGVDLIVLVPEDDDDTSGGQTIPWYGLPLLRALSDASGAPGPLMFGTGNIGDIDESSSDEKSPDSYYVEKFERLHENVVARTPWQSGMVFGVQMKLRVSPSLKMEDSPLGKPKGSKVNVSQFLTSEGLSGPASIFQESKGKPNGDPCEKMWMAGSCDPHTSFIFDLITDGIIPDSIELDELGSVPLKPVMQTCVLFTCIETDGAQPTPNYFTVSKMRVSSVTMDLAEDVESIFDSLDPEALSAILANKIALDVYIDGLVTAQSNLEQWTSSVMGALYESAMAQEAMMEEEKNGDFEFDASDRLLDQADGSLNETDILLGEGHYKARFIPLLAYAILQCDAFRPSGKGYKPSMDARLCAISQMASMTPKALANTLAPSLSLWSLKDDRAIVDILPLSKEGILDALDDLGEEATADSVLLLESTHGIFLFTADNLEESGSKGSEKKKSVWNQYLTIGENLRETIDGALTGYRTPPSQWKAIEELFENNKYVDVNDLEVPFSDLQAMLVEDMPTFAGDKNYSEWRSKMAVMIKDGVDVGNGKKTKGRGRLLRIFFGGK